MPPWKAPDRAAAGGAKLIAAGLLLIAAAPVLDVYMDRAPGSARHVLPEFLAPAYDQAGRVGVLGVVVSAGVVVTLWGCFLRTAGTGRPASRPVARVATGNGGSRLMRALGAEVKLDTARYVRDDPSE